MYLHLEEEKQRRWGSMATNIPPEQAAHSKSTRRCTKGLVEDLVQGYLRHCEGPMVFCLFDCLLGCCSLHAQGFDSPQIDAVEGTGAQRFQLEFA